MGYLFIKISLQWPDVTICLIQQKSKPYRVKLIATMRGEIWQTAETRVHLWCCTNPPTSPRPCIAPRCLVKTNNQGSTIHHDVLHHSSLMFWTTTYSMKSQAFLTSKVTANMRDWRKHAPVYLVLTFIPCGHGYCFVLKRSMNIHSLESIKS